MRLLLLIGLLGITSIEDSTSRASNPLKTAWLALYPESTKEREQECTGCAQSRIASNDPVLTELRVEYVKQQILKKLRLSKPPEVSLSLSTLPKPLTSGHVLELRPGTPSGPEKQVESFYGKTDQIVVFPKEDMENTRNCQLHTNHLSSINAVDCFTFSLPNEMQFVDVTSAELWFYKEADANDADNQTFVISELDHWDLDRSFQKNSIMAIFESSVGEGWIKTDVGYTVKKWVEEQRLSHTLQFTCNTCSTDRYSSVVSVQQTLKPFLVIHTSPLPQKNRPKRNSNCVPEMKECCRDELYISFDEIGWSAWILHPRGYHAYFCHGSCSSTASLTVPASPHSNIIRRDVKMMKNFSNTFNREDRVVQCSPLGTILARGFLMGRNARLEYRTYSRGISLREIRTVFQEGTGLSRAVLQPTCHRYNFFT